MATARMAVAGAVVSPWPGFVDPASHCSGLAAGLAWRGTQRGGKEMESSPPPATEARWLALRQQGDSVPYTGALDASANQDTGFQSTHQSKSVSRTSPWQL